MIGREASPVRVQRKRTKGWRMPENTAYVGRGSIWGNPITFSDVGAQYPSLDDTGIATLIVRDFRVLALRGHLYFPNWRALGGTRGPVDFVYPKFNTIAAELAGKNLSCWCPLDQPCHADVLLELANGGA